MAEQAEVQWRRLEPIALLVYFIKFLHTFVMNALPGLLPGFVWLGTLENNKKLFFFGILAFIVLIAIIFSFLSYLRFRYTFDQDKVRVKRGIFNRENLSMEYARVQTINIREPFYTRFLGVVVVGVDTAGSAGKEVTLAAVPKEIAETFRRRVAAQHQSHTPPVATESESDTTEETEYGRVLHRVQTPDLLRYGLSQINLLFVAILFGFISQFDDGFWAKVKPEWLLEMIDQAATLGLISKIVLGLAVLVFAFLLLWVFSVATAFLKYHKYVLYYDGTRFVYRAGLVNVHQKSIKHSRVQSLVITQNALSRIFGRVHLVVKVISAGEQGQNAVEAISGKRFVIPAITVAQACELARHFLPDAKLEDMTFTRPDRAYPRRIIRWIFLLFWIPVTILLAILAPWWTLLIPTAVFGLLSLIQFQSYRRDGIALLSHTGAIRSGFIGTSWALFEQRRPHRVDLRQSPGQRRKNLASLQIFLGSHVLQMPWIPLSMAQDIRDILLYRNLRAAAAADMLDQDIQQTDALPT